MIPNLPEPFLFFDMISILGTPANIPAFAAPSLATTAPDDTAWLLLGSAQTRDNFRPFEISTECDFTPDRSSMTFGETLSLEKQDGSIRARGRVPGAEVDIVLRPSSAVSHFANITGIYNHWSVLCEYEGVFTSDDPAVAPVNSTGLCTWEYARGRADVPLPILFFTYQILNIDSRTQVLMTELFGPGGLPLQQLVYVRDLDGNSYTRGHDFSHAVVDYLPTATTPDGAPMRLPRRLQWSVADDNGDELIHVDGLSNDDFVYGMAAGYAGSYQYTGRFRGAPISGRGYIEWIDRRKQKNMPTPA